MIFKKQYSEKFTRRYSVKIQNITFWSLSYSCWLNFVISVCSLSAACNLQIWDEKNSKYNMEKVNWNNIDLKFTAILTRPSNRYAVLWTKWCKKEVQLNNRDKKYCVYLLNKIWFRHFLHNIRCKSVIPEWYGLSRDQEQ